MHTKIDPEFYDLFHHLPTETKFAMLWMLTNRGLDVAGVCSVTKPRFEYETGVEWSQFGRACKAFGSDLYLLPSPSQGASEGLARPLQEASKELARAFEGASEELQSPSEGDDVDSDAVLIPTRYWIRSYVRKQVAQDGPSLAKSNVAKALVRAVSSADSPELLREFLLKYPSLASFFSSASSENTPSAQSPLQGASKPLVRGKRGEESTKRGEERHGEEGVQRENQNPSSPENKNPRAPGDIVPAPEVLARLGPIFGRQKNARASHVEETLAVNLHTTEEELSLVEAYYRLAVCEPDVFYPKRSLSALLHDYPSQCDRARAHFAADPLFSPEKKSAAVPEPEGWREVVLAKYPRASVHEFRSWFDLDRDIRKEFPQFPEDRYPSKKTASEPEPSDRALNPAAA